MLLEWSNLRTPRVSLRLRYTHTERQWQRQGPLEYMVTLPSRLGMGLGPIFKRHNAFQWNPIWRSGWRLTLDARCVHSFRSLAYTIYSTRFTNSEVLITWLWLREKNTCTQGFGSIHFLNLLCKHFYWLWKETNILKRYCRSILNATSIVEVVLHLT